MIFFNKTFYFTVGITEKQQKRRNYKHIQQIKQIPYFTS